MLIPIKYELKLATALFLSDENNHGVLDFSANLQVAIMICILYNLSRNIHS